MQVLITGGTGFIGSRLALRYLEMGHKVRVLAQANTGAEAENRALVEGRGAAVVLGSVTDPQATRKAVAGVQIVYHLAAAQHEAGAPDEHFWKVNVEGTRALLDAAAAAGVTRFVYGSTIGVYGAPENGPLDEDSPLRPDNVYGRSKRAAEELVLARADRLPVVVARIPETYGPGDRRLLKLFKMIDKGAFVMIGKGNNPHQPIYVDDLVEALVRIGESARVTGQIVLLAGKDVVTSAQMAEAIAKALGKPLRPWRIPMWPLLTAAVVLETLLRPFGIQPPLHRRRMDFFRKGLVLSGERARRLLGFEPRTGFGEGASATAEWYKEQGLL